MYLPVDLLQRLQTPFLGKMVHGTPSTIRSPDEKQAAVRWTEILHTTVKGKGVPVY
jgi:hypothetical protein